MLEEANLSSFSSSSTPPILPTPPLKSSSTTTPLMSRKRPRPGLPLSQPVGRFTFTFTPKHGSWLNIIEGFFSKLARSVLRHIRVSSKHELKERLMAFINDINHQPIVHTWHYKIGDAA